MGGEDAIELANTSIGAPDGMLLPCEPRQC